MFYISKKDNELIKSFTFFLKISKNVNKLHDELEKKYFENPKDLDGVFSFAIFNILRLDRADYMFDIPFLSIDSIVVAFNKVISLRNDYWLAWIFKCMFMNSFPKNLLKKVTVKITTEDDIKHLIELQKDADTVPYFIIPYFILADIYYSQNKHQETIDVIEEGLKIVSAGKVDYLSDYLSQPVKKLILSLKCGKEEHVIREIKERARILFPEDDYFQA
jgi:hypothetical protein